MTEYLLHWKMFKIHLISELGIIINSNLEHYGLFSFEILFVTAFTFLSYYFVNEISNYWRKDKIEANLLTEIIDSINDTPLMLVITDRNLNIIYSTRGFQEKLNLNCENNENENFIHLILNHKNHDFLKEFQDKCSAPLRFKAKVVLSVKNENNPIYKASQRIINENDFEDKLRRKECIFCFIEVFN